MLARRWLNANVSCCLMEANWSSGMWFYLEIWPDVFHHLLCSVEVTDYISTTFNLEHDGLSLQEVLLFPT